MMRSLFAGVSGLRTHQIRMDVIGNNIANVNTTAFKSGRALFHDMLAQTLRGGASASQDGSQGGINPMQVGLGTALATVDTMHSQGNLQTTGRITDLAIQGEGFFVLSDGTSQVYSRDGAFGLGDDGDLANPANGYKVQGWQADNNGVVDTSGALEALNIPIGLRMEAKETTQMTLRGNLDAAAAVGTQGTVTTSMNLLTYGAGTDLLSVLFNSSGTDLGLDAGSAIVISGDGGATSTTFTTVAGTTLADLATAIQTELRNTSATATVTVDSSGRLAVSNPTGGGAALLDIQIQSGDPTPNTYLEGLVADLQGAMALDGSATSGTTLTYATGTDYLTNLFNVDGTSLGLSVSDVITVDGKKGTVAVAQGSLTVAADTALSDLAAAVESTFSITNTTGVVVNATGGVTINGDTGAGYGVTDVAINTSTGNNILKTAMTYTQTQAANGGLYTTSVQVYDSLGEGHAVTLVFDKYAANVWRWQAIESGGEVGVGTKTVTFASSGAYLSEGGGAISFDPGNGALGISIDPIFTGMTQYAGDYTVSVATQDGFEQGELNGFAISADGTVTGSYTNGMTRTLGRIAVAKFNNPSGMVRVGENLFASSANSGLAQIGSADSGGRGSINSGTLEMSNVDLAQEFTDMIITQRGFQTNARIITTADEMLQELVNLKR